MLFRWRGGTPADGDVICEFNRRMALETEGKALDPVTLRAGVEAMLRDERKGRYFVCERDGQVIGQLGVTAEWSDWRNGFFWWIQSVYVASAARRQGVFRALYRHVEERARAEPDVLGLRLYVERDNRIAQATYEALGMSRTPYQVMEVSWPGRGS